MEQSVRINVYLDSSVCCERTVTCSPCGKQFS